MIECLDARKGLRYREHLHQVHIPSQGLACGMHVLQLRNIKAILFLSQTENLADAWPYLLGSFLFHGLCVVTGCMLSLNDKS